MPRNILLIMTDQQRAEYVGYVPEGVADTPNINRIAQEGTYFTCCNTTNPICSPARTSLITGRYPRQIGTLTMSGDLFPQIPTFMQALQKAGYVTYGIGKFHYNQTYPWSTPRGCGMDPVAGEQGERSFGYDFVWETAGKQQTVSNYCFYCDYLQKKGMLDQVRDFFEQCGGPNGDVPHHNFDKAMPWPFAEEDYIDVVTGRVAREQLSRHPAEKPFYMKVSFCGPHKPYDAPQRYLDMFPLEQEDDFLLPEGQVIAQKDKEALWRQRRSSKAMIKLIDDQIGEILRLLEKRGMMEDTLVLFTSDHGDMLGDHYLLQKGFPGDRRSMSRWQSACLGQNQQEKIRTRLNCPIWRQRYWTMQGWMRVRRSAAAGLPITISFHPVLCCPCCGERPTAAGIFALRKVILRKSACKAYRSRTRRTGGERAAAAAMHGRRSLRKKANILSILDMRWGKNRMRNSMTCVMIQWKPPI